MEKLNTEKRRFIEIISRMMGRWGYNHTDGKVYSILLLSEKPLTINELTEMSNSSRTTISTSLSRLVRDYRVAVRKRGKTKLFFPISSLLDRFLEQPREILERDVIPLEKIIKNIISREKAENKVGRLVEILKDIEKSESILKEIIGIERKYRIKERG